MNRAVRFLVFFLAAAICAQSLLLCRATGWRPFTRYRSPEIEAVNADRGLESLFAATPLNESHGTLGSIENVFAFGWLPSGPGKDAVSVLTVGGPALLIGLLALWPARRRSTPKPKSDRLPEEKHA